MRLAAVLCAMVAGPAAAETILSARFTDPTTRYAHGVLGDAVEWGGLEITTRDPARVWSITLPDNQVFEDLTPRLWDITGDGLPEVVVVLSAVDTGASLVVMGLAEGAVRQIAATPHIGRRNRWLAPVGAADLDGDGRVEIGYIDRPHLAKVLRVWTFAEGALTPFGAVEGLTNHRIGQDFIQGGLRDCGQGPEFVTADADWRGIMGTRFEAGALTTRPIGPYDGPDSLRAALDC